ncbi:phosphatase PAP2 family protein [Roseibium sp. RKSG952]|uniref:acid phosphatase n=1 Tax=Roseibium sp. RKSG952 TaxID=2529384 RepID=UPI0012BB8564|nr:phosphatase PAP2 family protein [Roseibium sp. RKSG952]MTI00341.1 phosphatase PAP2 family protein [Roseibium sp. RKSG952]
MFKRAVLPFLLIVTIAFSGALQAKDIPAHNGLSIEAVDGAQLIGPPPENGSVEDQADLAVVLWMQRTRTTEQIAFAIETADFSLETFAPILSEELLSVNGAALQGLVDAAWKDIYPHYRSVKDTYARPRPFLRSPSVHPLVEPSKSPSYPSGHSTHAMFYGQVLADIFPDRAEELVAFAEKLGHARVVAGVHYPSDVIAGQKLGKAYAKAIKHDPGYAEGLSRVFASDIAN